MEHLLNLYPFTSILWDWVASVFRQTDRDNLSITNTLNKLRKYFLGNEIINKAWTLVPGFLISDVQKECNGRILKKKTGSTQNIISQILRHLKDTVGAMLGRPPENLTLPQDTHILLQLGLHSLVPQSTHKDVSQINDGKDFQQPLPHGFLKINRDGASKGNPGMDGFGRVIRDERGCIKDIFHSHLGTTTNNMAELMALEQCLEILIESNSHSAIIEADSELVIMRPRRSVMEKHLEKFQNNGGFCRYFSAFIPTYNP